MKSMFVVFKAYMIYKNVLLISMCWPEKYFLLCTCLQLLLFKLKGLVYLLIEFTHTVLFIIFAETNK